ncbi:MAG: hypothetical protein RLZZ271_1057, partial [Pseudomonadota bacterium]
MMRKTIFTSSTTEAVAGSGRNARTRSTSFANGARLTAGSLAIAVMLACFSGGAQAFSLGKLQVQSALGEPLLAEIDLTDVRPEEEAGLSATIASPDIFKSMGVEYNTALTSARITLAKRANGSSYLKLSSDRAVNEPFVDMIIEVTWPAGRLVRDFTLLLDPRNLAATAPIQPQLPVTQSAAPQTAPYPASAPSPETPAPVQAVIAPSPAAPDKPARPQATGKSRPGGSVSAKVAPTASAAAKPEAAPSKSVTVKEGDTAGRIAQRNLSGKVSLDQMLAAMLRSNPDAFINGDINRIKAGAVVQTPDAETAAQISPEQAKQILVASSRDFAQYKQRAAQLAPLQTTEKPARQATGSVDAKVVEDKKAATSSPDKLKLAKGSVQGGAQQPSTAQSVAQAKQAADTKEKAAEVNK